MDAYRHRDQFVVNLDLPGVDPASIDLVVEKNMLTVRAGRVWPRREGDEVLVAERPQGSFIHQLFVADTLDADNIEARYDKGVLTLRVPVREEANARRVQVVSASGAPGRHGGGRGSTEASSRDAISDQPGREQVVDGVH